MLPAELSLVHVLAEHLTASKARFYSMPNVALENIYSVKHNIYTQNCYVMVHMEVNY